MTPCQQTQMNYMSVTEYIAPALASSAALCAIYAGFLAAPLKPSYLDTMRELIRIKENQLIHQDRLLNGLLRRVDDEGVLHPLKASDIAALQNSAEGAARSVRDISALREGHLDQALKDMSGMGSVRIWLLASTLFALSSTILGVMLAK